MYERNAIVLERYFDSAFGYDRKNNLKTNFAEYSELVKCLEEYKNVSEEEEGIVQDYDEIANKIREIQKKQESMTDKMTKLQEERNNLFQNIDENADSIRKKIDLVNNDIDSVNEEIKDNAKEFIDVVKEFSNKTDLRTKCGKSRRTIENEYNKKLNQILDDYKEIDPEIAQKAAQFIETDTENIEEELKKKMQKNGENEKIPFNAEVLTKAICLGVDIQKRETDILANIYEKTNRLFTEIKNNSVRLDKHKRIIKDSKCKLDFISAIKEYLFEFLDNERLTAVNGEEDHTKLMKNACKNLDEDLVQINNLYTLLLKEISRKITKKSYIDLYKLGYLKELEKKAEEFEIEVKKLKLPVTIINPNHWRIEGMKKIYNVFGESVTVNYGRDLSEFIIEEEEMDEDEEINDDEDEEDVIKQIEVKPEEPKVVKEKNESKKSIKAELDKKIDMILGFDNKILNKPKKEIDEEKKYDENDEFGYRWNNDREENDWDSDDWDDDENETDLSTIWDDEEDDDEEDSYTWDDDEIEEKKDNENNYKWDDEEEDTESSETKDEDDLWNDDESDSSSDEKIIKDEQSDDDWGNEFVKNDDKKGKHRKKKSFFDKFRK